MVKPSYGSVLTCIISTGLLMAYLILLNKKKNFLFKYGTGTFLALTLLLILRAFLPCNFFFSHNVSSQKILPPLVDFITYKLFGVFSLMNTLTFIWILGFLIRIMWLVSNQYRFYRFIKGNDIITSYNDLLQKLMKRYKRPVKIRIMKTSFLKSPCITGLIHPSILLPDIDFSEKEAEYIISHELEHFYHHDLWIRLFCEILVCMYWWNPLVYPIKKQLATALEFSNDFSITREMDELEKLDYLDCLVKVAKNQPSVATTKTPALCFSENKTSILKQRTDFVLYHNHGSRDRAYFINFSVIVSLILISFLFVVEPCYPIPPEVAETTMSLDIDHTFFIENGQCYDVYFYNQYVGQADSLDSFPSYIIYKNKEEAKQYEEIE